MELVEKVEKGSIKLKPGVEQVIVLTSVLICS